MKYIVNLNKVEESNYPYAGGKGTSLAKMMKLKLPVPAGAILLSNAMKNGEIIPEALEELKTYISGLKRDVTYAIRSSALNEDGETASFAGAYETVTDVSVDDVQKTVYTVIKSADAERVKRYAGSMNAEESGIAIVIQEFVKPTYAGVLFTSDIITGSSLVMQGNFVCGEGESLVSGQSNAYDFTISTKKGIFSGDERMKSFSDGLYKYARKIRKSYGLPMDIEWAVSNRKLYILQARPITTLRRLDADTYRINGSLSGDYLFSKTNVGEIFMSTVSPMTFSALENICDMLGVPCFLDNICGQAYCNVSVVCSALVSFGFSKTKAYMMISDIAGALPEGVEVPIHEFDKKQFLRKMRKLVFGSPFGKKKMSKDKFLEKMPEISEDIIQHIRMINTNEELKAYWDEVNNDFVPLTFAVISDIFPLLGPFLNTGKKLTKITGEDLAGRLCAGCSGGLESMKPLLLLEDVINGKLSREEYVKICGHRSVDEMELAKPYPYENPNFMEERISMHKESGVNIHQMQENQRLLFEQAKAEFAERFPHRVKWLERTMAKYVHVTQVREEIRGKAVWLFCILREFALRIASINHLGEDVFMLSLEEALGLIDGDDSVLQRIPERKENYLRYSKYPAFPNIIKGRFEPEQWIALNNHRQDYFCAFETVELQKDVSGYPGAAGEVKGVARVIFSLADADKLLPGEILVTTATNIGWTMIFPKAAAIVTDIGAPLSHAAIVAREFGIPAVVGCGNATTIIKTGDEIVVNGSQGSVSIGKKSK